MSSSLLPPSPPEFVHPAVVKRAKVARIAQLRGPIPLDTRLLTWPQRREILELFREAQHQRGMPSLSPPAANEPPDDVA